jgi:hypothetical protein
MIHTCRLCGMPVDCSDAVDLRDIAAILLAHLTLSCTRERRVDDEPAERRMIEP